MATHIPLVVPSSILRLITCGSVDDGKSTLIGRLLYDAGLVHEDQLADLARDSARLGAAGTGLDFSLLLDGLEAEREQKITIDVAYRYFATPKRRFILADTPGHEQYTRNMATGASTADAAIVLVDARKGILPQTRRHTQIVRMMGIRHVVLAVNKMDLVDFDDARFAEIRDAFSALTADMGFRTVHPVPVAAREGDNVVLPSEAMGWHKGPPLLAYLEALDAREAPVERSFRFPVQWVNRPNAEFRGFAGTVASGRAAPGDALVVLPAGTPAKLQRIVTFEGEAASAREGEAVTLVLDREVDASRGDMLVPAADRPEVADQFRARIVWLGSDQLLPQRPYHMKIGTRTVRATVTELRHRLDLETGHEDVAKVLGQNEIGEVNLSIDQAIAFDPYEENRVTGGFILIDRLSDETVAAGMIDFALRRAQNIAWQPLTIDKQARAVAKGQRPAVLWFTGLSGSGKSTIANLVESALFQDGRHTYLLDGDNVRHGLNRDLGFTDADRVENVRRVAEVARLMVDAGLIVICSFISPFRAERRLARELLAPGEFVEIFVDTPIEVCEARDPKGLYAKARAGKIKNFTGIDSEFEIPETPELVLEGHDKAPAENAAAVIALLQSSGIIR